MVPKSFCFVKISLRVDCDKSKWKEISQTNLSQWWESVSSLDGPVLSLMFVKADGVARCFILYTCGSGISVAQYYCPYRG